MTEEFPPRPEPFVEENLAAFEAEMAAGPIRRSAAKPDRCCCHGVALDGDEPVVVTRHGWVHTERVCLNPRHPYYRSQHPGPHLGPMLAACALLGGQAAYTEPPLLRAVVIAILMLSLLPLGWLWERYGWRW